MWWHNCCNYNENYTFGTVKLRCTRSSTVNKLFVNLWSWCEVEARTEPPGTSSTSSRISDLWSTDSLLTLFWLCYWLSSDFCRLSTDFLMAFLWRLLTSSNICWLSTDFLLTSTDSLSRDVLMYWLFTDFYWLSTNSNKCNQCDYASSRADHLRTYFKIHSREKLYNL